MKHVVITGGSRGIGLGLAKSFLNLGCRVTICASSPKSVDKSVADLFAEIREERVAGIECDVTDVRAVQLLWEFAQSKAPIDIWINNAGISGPQVPFVQLASQNYEQVVDVNLVGMLNGCRVAAEGFVHQGYGHIYNMEGMGSDGRLIMGLAVYGSTKRALRYFTQALSAELKHSPVGVSALSPGIVLTDLLLEGLRENSEQFANAQKILNILADEVDTVTPWLARKVLGNQKSGTLIAWLTIGKILFRFLRTPFSKRDLFSSQI